VKNYLISKEALKDIDTIWLYTLERWSLEQADRYYNLIMDEIEYISHNSDAGYDFGNIRKGYQFSKVKSHLIFYKTTDNGKVEIIRILHEKMNIDNYLR